MSSGKKSSKSDSTPPASALKPDTAESEKLNTRIAELERQLESERVAHASTRAELDQVKVELEAASTHLAKLKTRGKDTLDNLQKQLSSVTVERDEAWKKIAVLEKPSGSSKTTSSATPGPALLKPKSADSEITLVDEPPKPTAVDKPLSRAIDRLIAAEYSRAVAPALKRAVEEPPKPAAVEKPSPRAIDRLIAAEHSRTVAPAPKDGGRVVVDNSRTIAPAPKDGARAAVSVAPSVTTVAPVVSPDALNDIMRRLEKFEAMEKRLEALEGGFKDHGTRIQGLDEAVEEHSEGLAVVNKSVRFLHGRIFGKDDLHAPATDGAAEVPVPSAEIESAAPGPAMAAPAAVEGASTAPAEGEAASTVPAEGEAASTVPAEGEAASTVPAEGEAASTSPAVAP
jgi:uncharacterized coiled-coil protein SlyX